MKSVLFFLLAIALPAAALDGRKTTARDLSVELTRFELPNGMVVLLAPDKTGSSVFVSTSFRAGTLYEPKGCSGMAHLVEHIMATGSTPDTDYAALLERRRSRFFNAYTDFETMEFQTIVPAEELPAALWVSADRLGSIPPLIDDKLVERNRKIVLQERAIRDVDAPYGMPREKLFTRLFAVPHPLHGNVIGTVGELSSVTGNEVRKFVETVLVPANGILTIVGRFEVNEARRWIEQTLGRLPPGQRASTPRFPPLQVSLTDTADEIVSRDPAVTMAWRLPMPHDEAVTLALGAQLLSFMTDGAWGMRLGAGLLENEAESLFMVQLVVPYDEPASAVQSDAEGFVRILTRTVMPLELYLAANVVLDRVALFDLDTIDGRAARLTRLERLFHSRVTVADEAAQHWLIDPSAVRDLSRNILESPRVVLHARPTRPRPARVAKAKHR